MFIVYSNCELLCWVLLDIDSATRRCLKWFAVFERVYRIEQRSNNVGQALLSYLSTPCGSQTVQYSFKSTCMILTDLFLIFSRLACDFTELHEFIICGFFIWTISTVCTPLISLQGELVESNPIEWISPLLLGAWSFVMIFFFCEFGAMVTNQFNRFNEELDQCDWYLFPVELQRTLLIVMINTQNPIIIRGYGNTLCTRDALKQATWANKNEKRCNPNEFRWCLEYFSLFQTIKGGFSYFAMLRQVDSWERFTDGWFLDQTCCNSLLLRWHFKINLSFVKPIRMWHFNAIHWIGTTIH